ncbi:hypothetical protein HID58_060193, partial [Brassica napus]
ICDRLVSNPEDIPNRLEVDIQFYINHQSIFSTAYVTSCAKYGHGKNLARLVWILLHMQQKFRSIYCVVFDRFSFGLVDAFVQGGIAGDFSFMCPDFIQAFVGGLGIAGSLTSGLRLITKAIFDKSSNVLSIRIATLIQLGCLILYVTVFAKLPIVKYYHSKAWKEGAKSVAGDLASVTSKSKLNRFGSNNSEKNTSAMVFIHLRVLLVFLVLPANTDFMGDSGCWCFTTITKTL